MKKLTAGDPETKSADIVGSNIEALRSLFPEAFGEGGVDFEVLKQLLGAAVDERDERYGLSWHGKRRARQLALIPSSGTLIPCPEESVGWDSTQNLMIEGDNLEVLKILQKSFGGKVKMIYIDPPYNRDADVIYNDDFTDPVKNYQMLTGQIASDGRKLTSAAEASGRYHTEWLNMMFPRLRVAHSLLQKNGVIFCSIDDAEVAHLRIMMDEIFGQENFVAELIWEGANKNDARQVGVCHEYVLIYARNRESVEREWGLNKEGVEPVLREVARLKKLHGADHETASAELAGWFRANKAKPAFANRRFRNIDDRGAYKEDDPTAPGGRKFELRNPLNGKVIPLRPNRGWSFDQEEFNRLVEEKRITFVTETTIMVRRYLHETDKLTPPSVFYQPARSASERLNRLMGAAVFDYPKDEAIIQKFVQMACGDQSGSIVMDFFAGSGTTAHAVLMQNAADSLDRRFILVQLPEMLDESRPEQKIAAEYCLGLGRPRNIAELTKERLKRSAASITAASGSSPNDNGFRVYKLAPSNIRSWQPNASDLEGTLLANAEHLVPGRTEADVLTELLLKLGLDLCVPIARREMAGKTVHSVGGGVLMVCLADGLNQQVVEALAHGIVCWRRDLAPAGDTRVVFKDSGFADDVAKTNMAAILQQNGITDVRSL
ncbi:site-specific DNA-methyltransferase [Falsiroseomonas ponticola]|uniref:site-specific DNA-methyltransferase n=1 Tax=Falsiroseomonas ponticola TaxID=2786951 RepID=UPI0019319443|nr:site-specific DNA-methyltransferase [Roseomonas ponticola]